MLVGHTVDGASERIKLEATLAALRQELKQLAAAGHGGGFAPGSAPSEVKTFRENQAKHAAEQGKVVAFCSALAELKASAAPAPGQLAAMEGKVSRAVESAENLRMILLRQQSIKGFWREPSHSHRAKAAEIKAMEAQLVLFTGA